MHFVTCPKLGREMEAVVLHRVGFLAYSCPKQGQDFKPSATPLYPNMGQVPPPPGTPSKVLVYTFPKVANKIFIRSEHFRPDKSFRGRGRFLKSFPVFIYY